MRTKIMIGIVTLLFCLLGAALPVIAGISISTGTGGSVSEGTAIGVGSITQINQAILVDTQSFAGISTTSPTAAAIFTGTSGQGSLTGSVMSIPLSSTTGTSFLVTPQGMVTIDRHGRMIHAAAAAASVNTAGITNATRVFVRHNKVVLAGGAAANSSLNSAGSARVKAKALGKHI